MTDAGVWTRLCVRDHVVVQLTKLVHVMPKGALLTATAQEHIRALQDDELSLSTELEQARYQVCSRAGC